MAIDTAAKRKAALNFGRYTGVMPLVDGDIANAADRQAALGGYIGIPVLSASSSPVLTTYAASYTTHAAIPASYSSTHEARRASFSQHPERRASANG